MSEHDHDELVELYGICTVCARATAAENVARRDPHLARVLAAAPADWKDKARKAIRGIAASMDEFTTDDVWLIIPTVEEPRALGPLMLEAERAGLIYSTDRTKVSTNPRNHARRVTIWRSTQPSLLTIS